MNPPPGNHHKQVFVAISGAVLGPMAVYTIYMIVGRLLLSRGSRWIDWLFAALSIGTGIWFLWQLPLGRWTRIFMAIAYIPLAFAAIAIYSIEFVCRVYRDCL